MFSPRPLFNTDREYGAPLCAFASLIVSVFSTTLNSSCIEGSSEFMSRSTVWRTCEQPMNKTARKKSDIWEGNLVIKEKVYRLSCFDVFNVGLFRFAQA